MAISRRGFLGFSAAAAATLFSEEWQPRIARGESARPVRDCLLVSSQAPGSIGESFAGYRTAMAASGVSVDTSSNIPGYFAARCVILPEMVFSDAVEARKLCEHLRNGSAVLLESGAAFLSLTEFNLQRCLLWSELGLNLHRPVDLWAGNEALRRSPYIDFEWPVRVKIRDFSRAIPVEGAGAETIAWFRGMPLAVKRREGKGTLVFLGSPIGPHLLAGDQEASRWLRQLCLSV